MALWDSYAGAVSLGITGFEVDGAALDRVGVNVTGPRLASSITRGAKQSADQRP